MKLAIVLAVLLSSVVVDAEKGVSSYRRRHLTTFQEVCFPTASPVAPTSAPVHAPVTSPTKGKGGTVVGGPTTKSGPIYSPGTSTKSGGTVYSPPPPANNNKNGGTVYSPPPPANTNKNGGTVYSPPPPANTNKNSGTVYSPAPPPGSGPVYSPGGSGKRAIRRHARQTSFERQLQTISLNTTFSTFDSYPLPSAFSGYALLTWPNYCFQATITVHDFIPNCQGCVFVVTDGSHSCNASSIPSVIPFIDSTEIGFDPYTNSTFFNTDRSGDATVTVPIICTGTGPQDNYQRPLLLLNPTGQIAACGILSYVCP